MTASISAASTRILLVAVSVICLSGNAFAALSDAYFNCVNQRENANGTPATKNSYGFLGNYQLGVSAATDAKICSNATAKSGNDWSKCDFNGALAQSLGLTGTWAERYAQFTTGANAASHQLAAAQAYSNANWNYIVNDLKKQGKDVNDYLDKPGANGMIMTREVIQAMAHLLGHTGAANFLVSGVDGSDGNNVSGSSYAACVGSCLQGGAGASGGNANCTYTYSGACAEFHQGFGFGSN